jgi:hypothetical protein
MTIFWAKSLPACAPLLSLRAKPCRFARLQILSFNPFTGNGIYEKTPRCPGGWSVGCKCFCTGACSRSGPRPCSPSAHGCTRCTCSCCPGTRRQNQGKGQGHQNGQKENHQEGRQEKDHPQGSLTLACSTLRGVMHIASKSPATAGVFFFPFFSPSFARRFGAPCADAAPLSRKPCP